MGTIYVFAAFGILAAPSPQPLQVRLEFSGISHPFVAAVRALHQGSPVPYLALSPSGDDHVYFMPDQAERFESDTAALLRIEATGAWVDAAVLQEGSEPRALEAVRWDLQSWPKIPVQHIWLRRDEGAFASKEFVRRNTDNIWKTANQQLAEWARTAPTDGSFHRVTYEVDYGEGKKKFLGDYNLRFHDTQLANLGRRLRRWAAPRTGRWSIPLSPLSADYSAAKARQLAAEHEEWLDTIAGRSTGRTDRFIQLIVRGELLDDSSVEPGDGAK